MTLLQARLLRDGLRAGLVTRDQWCALVVRWLDDVEMAAPWMLDMLDADSAEAAATALSRGFPDLPDVVKDEDATEHEPWPLLGFLYVRHERGLPLWNLLTEALEWCSDRYYYADLDELGGLRSEYEYSESIHDGVVPAHAVGDFERRAQTIFERHRRVAHAWWEVADADASLPGRTAGG